MDLIAAVLRVTFLICMGLLLLAPAMAQSGAPSDPKAARNGDEPFEFVHAVPKTPGEYHPITAEGRLKWFARSTVGPKSLFGGIISAGYGTAADHPHEYGTHWEGFGKRYGMRLTGVSTGNAMEAAIGSLWGEDPRYFHTVHQSIPGRAKNILDLTFRTYRRDGERHPAYARYISTVASNFLSNTWRAHSEADWQHALLRSGEGFGAHCVSNAVSEFLPLVWGKVRHKPDPYPADLRLP